MSFKWDDLDFFQSGEWDVIQERLEDLRKAKVSYNPDETDIFRAFDETPFDTVTVAIIAQDPYPAKEYATGVAFSIPEGVRPFPATLANIFNELVSDLHLPYPSTGNLEAWCKQGVLLWNSSPTCNTGAAGSHANWPEWDLLNEEIIRRLSEKGVVFVFLGNRAKRLQKYIVNPENNRVVEYTHPSPLGILNSKINGNFKGGRMFSTVNAKLVELKKTPIDWRL